MLLVGFLFGVDEMEEKNNSWYERGELPPVGIECEYLCDEFGNYKACKILAIHGYTAAFCIDAFANTIFTGANSTHKFRPIRTEREKTIEAALSVMLTNTISNTQHKTINKLYDAGLLRLPESK